MCCTAFRQLRLLLWKNMILHLRQARVTAFEILLPLIFSLFLIVIRVLVESKTIDVPTTWPAFNISDLPNRTILRQPIIGQWNLMYSPDTSAAAIIMERVINSTGGRIRSAYGFPSEDAMINQVMNNSTRAATTLGCIVFSNFPNGTGPIPQQVSYKIRLSYRPRAQEDSYQTNFGTWMTQYQFPVFQAIGPRQKDDATGGDPGYYREGFLTLQYHIDRAIMAMLGVNAAGHVEMQRIPYPPYRDDDFILVIQQQFAFFLLIGFIYTALNITKIVCYEKEKKLKETMRMMGLQSWLHWTAWFIDFFLKLFVVCVGIIIICKVPVGKHGRVLAYSNALPVLLFLLLYVACVIFFCFAISTFFKTARSGATAGGLLFLLSYLPFSFLQQRYSTTSTGLKVLSCVLPNMALALGGTVIGQLEGTGAGLQWDNIASGVSVDDQFSMGFVLIMMLFDCFFYMTIAWYKEAVSPGDYGIPQPWCFPFMASYWCGTRPKTIDIHEGGLGLAENRTNGSFGNPNIEQDPRNLRCTISLRNLTRVFGSGSKKKVAVDNLSINIYEGQITALLGHNGAGKTTTMSMIAGFIPSSSGEIYVNDLDIRRNLTTVRQQLGLCPQHDVLFDSLTVEEHLRFFARLKNYDESLLDAEVNRLIAATNLESKRKAMSKTLSGGMKRRLSVAIALVGGSKVVILDEPTSGLDPSARRELWTFLQAERSRCTILLSTHFMDEADFLGDRIAIMASGEVQCCGSSLFLKSRYGAGYHLTMVKTARCDPGHVLRIIQDAVPEAQLESDVGDELSFILPTEAAAKFEALFSHLETDSESLGIGGYGASITTMEEVFLKVGERAVAESESIVDTTNQHSLNNINGNGVGSTSHLVGASAEDYMASRNRGVALFLQQVRGIFVKRMIHSARNYVVSITQLIIPIVFTAIGLLVLKTVPLTENLPALTLSLTPFGSQVITVASSPTATNADRSLASAYAAQFASRTQTTFLNLTGVNESAVFQRLSDLGDGDLAQFNREYLVGGFFSDGRAKSLFNNQPYHTPGIALNALSNSYLREKLPGALITTQNAPLPMTDAEKVTGQSEMLIGFGAAVNVVLGMAYLAASFAFFLVKERVTKVKLLHFVSGTSKTGYWLATFLWDFVNFLIPTLGILIVFLGFGIDAYTGSAGRVFGILLLLMLYGWAIIPYVYNFSYIFTVPSSAISVISAINFITGLATLSTVVVLQSLQTDKTVADILRYVFTFLFPNYGLGQALVDYYTNYIYADSCGKEQIQVLCKFITHPCCKGNCAPNCIDWTDNYLGFDKGGIGLVLVALVVQGFFFFAVCIFLESSLAVRLRAALLPSRYASTTEYDNAASSSTPLHLKMDNDVAAERARTVNSDIHWLTKSHSLVLSEVTHLYGQHLAVDRLSCAISSGECFGLLGVNGAGKTTTFKMITGDIPVSQGDAYINGHSVTNAVEKVRLNLGYCPQFDGLIDHLTGREMLYLFARLRGLKEELIETEVNHLLSALLLVPHADKMTRTFSGGNKRKLSTAMALVGGPAVVCLDEPTTGMDPVARRHLWRTVANFRERGHTLVLTSHSMEECEALCTKIAIMVNGQFKCFGSCQHLKAKFGSGYSLQIQVPFSTEEGASRVANAQEFVESQFPSAELMDIHQGVLHYHIHPDENLGWSRVFGILERNKEALMLENYSVSQTTLEQVFLSFAKNQIPPEEINDSCLGACWRCLTCSSKS